MKRPAASAPAGPVVADATFGADAPVLPGTCFESCTFDGTNLQERDLGASRFVDCTFLRANLSVAKVDGCTFQGTAFRECKLAGIDWSGVARFTATRFEECDLTRSAFLGLALRGLVMRACRAREAVFCEADLTEADLSRTDLTGAQFGRTKLAGADLRGAVGWFIHPAENDMRGARVSLPEALAFAAAFGVIVEP